MYLFVHPDGRDVQWHTCSVRLHLAWTRQFFVIFVSAKILPILPTACTLARARSLDMP